MASRLAEIQAEVVCCQIHPRKKVPTQPPGSLHPTSRVATHGKRVAPISHPGDNMEGLGSSPPYPILVASYDMHEYSSPILTPELQEGN